ncbi:MAG: efflux RND transporter periplasmic adaptor subunit [Planctomycetota bacterium]
MLRHMAEFGKRAAVAAIKVLKLAGGRCRSTCQTIEHMLGRAVEKYRHLSWAGQQAVLAAGIIVCGLLIAGGLIASAEAPKRSQPDIAAPLVRAQQVARQSIQVIVKGNGTVQAKTVVQIIPQVSGKVVRVSDNLVNGGFFRANEPLLSIDKRDFELSMQRAAAGVARAKVKLDLESAEGEVARREWEQLHPDTAPPTSLVVREPQIRQAKAELEAAEAELATAKLNLERTDISLPFDGRVVDKSVDPGQYVSAGMRVGTVYGIDAVEIEVPLEDRELAWFDVAGAVRSEKEPLNSRIGSEAEVMADFAGSRHKWTGYVVRTAGEIDASSRMVHIVVEVKNPFAQSQGRAALVPGMFVDIAIKGKMLRDVILVPRGAIHNRDEVWVISEGQLRIRRVKIVRFERDLAYVTEGLEDGQQLIVSSLDMVTDGMAVRSATAAKEDRSNDDSR